jgi:hypothetical protein
MSKKSVYSNANPFLLEHIKKTKTQKRGCDHGKEK